MTTMSDIQVRETCLNDIFKLALKLKIPKQVDYSETESERYIVIFGMYRIVQNKLNSNIYMETYKLLSLDSGRWARNVDNSFLKYIPVFYTGAVYMLENLFKDALNLLLKEVIELGYVVKGEMKVGIHRCLTYPDLLEFEHKHAYFCGGNLVPTSEKTNFTYGKGGLVIDKGFLTRKDKENIKKINNSGSVSADTASIEIALWSRFKFVSDFSVGLKSLNLAVRKLLEKNVLSSYLKINCNSVYYRRNGKSAFSLRLWDYIDFMGKFDIKNDLGGASPLLRLVNPKNEKVCVIDGSNRQLMKLSKLDKYISRNDVRFLRKSNPTLSFFLALEIEGKLQFKRRNTSKLKSKEYFSITMMLMKNIYFMKLPVTLRFRILYMFERNCTLRVSEFQQSDFPKLGRVIIKWLEYHKELYKNIKYRSSIARWDTEMNYLDHVLEWVIRVKPLIHKNQTWESFHKLAVAWGREINGGGHKNYPSEWKAINIDTNKISDTYQIKEITNVADLNKEGDEMLHCISSYHDLCASGRYRVFSIFNEEERATLGLSLKNSSDKYILDQVRGAGNVAVSSKAKKTAKEILNSVNALCA
ncbi:pcfJ-like family protein (plasmid) [Yersinia frederiksenii Y225]|nr:pcfJ-like family protein [Yersinia frederiksenii Y225]